MSIGKFCNRNVVCAKRETSVVDAALLMRRHHIGDVVVVDETSEGRRPVGIVTDRDLVVEVLSAGLDPGAVKVGDLLIRPLVTIEEGTGYMEAVRLMASRGVRRIPVVSPGGLLVGIVSFDDLLHQLAVPLAELSELAIREWRQEAQARQ